MEDQLMLPRNGGVMDFFDLVDSGIEGIGEDILVEHLLGGLFTRILHLIAALGVLQHVLVPLRSLRNVSSDDGIYLMDLLRMLCVIVVRVGDTQCVVDEATFRDGFTAMSSLIFSTRCFVGIC